MTKALRNLLIAIRPYPRVIRRLIFMLVRCVTWQQTVLYFPQAALPARRNLLTGRIEVRYGAFNWQLAPSSYRQYLPGEFSLR